MGNGDSSDISFFMSLAFIKGSSNANSESRGV
jgi:hypothetical protein